MRTDIYEEILQKLTAALWPSSAICGGLLFSAGRPGGLIREIAWKAGESEVICLHGGLRLCRLAGHPRLIIYAKKISRLGWYL